MTIANGADVDASDPSAQRIDRWLWCARFFKTRSIAAKFISDGSIRLTRTEIVMRIKKPSFLIRPGDILVFSRNEHACIINILSLAKRRGPATEAQMLYEDQSPPLPPKLERHIDPFGREAGSGRPTKKDRRALDALKTT